MTEEPLPQFGTCMDGIDYVDRVSVYGIAINDAGQALVCRRTLDRIVLPGGGVDSDEDLLQALHREITEETGHRVTSERFLFSARQYHANRGRKPAANKLCHFYVVDLKFDPDIEKEDDHEPVWLPPDRLAHSMTFESHAWALNRAVSEHQRNG